MGHIVCRCGLNLLFYLVFYGFLAGIFTLNMWIFLQTLDEYTPVYRDRIVTPGLVIKPDWAMDGPMKLVFNRSEPYTYDEYVRSLWYNLQDYSDDFQERNVVCIPGRYFIQASEGPKQACQFLGSSLSQCSGLHDSTFGYADGKPCVLIKMNRIIGLIPQGEPYIECTAKRERPLEIQYFPKNGTLDLMYFPYYGKMAHRNYVQPVVAAKLMLQKEDYNTELTVQCKVMGTTNLLNGDPQDKYLGRVTFKVLVTE